MRVSGLQPSQTNSERISDVLTNNASPHRGGYNSINLQQIIAKDGKATVLTARQATEQPYTHSRQKTMQLKLEKATTEAALTTSEHTGPVQHKKQKSSFSLEVQSLDVQSAQQNHK